MASESAILRTLGGCGAAVRALSGTQAEGIRLPGVWLTTLSKLEDAKWEMFSMWSWEI